VTVGECDLQDLSFEHGKTRLLKKKKKNFEPEDIAQIFNT
jgi:NADH dehydrogenase/NADH:ubiquinone oxidoreductase subunit G